MRMEEFGGGQDYQCSLPNKAVRRYTVCLMLNGAVLVRNPIDAKTLVVLVEVLVEVYHCSQHWPQTEGCAGEYSAS